MVPWVKRRRSRQSFPWQDGRSSVRNLGKRREGDANEGASWYGREMAERSHPGPGWLRVVASGDDAEPAERRRDPTIRRGSCRGGLVARGRRLGQRGPGLSDAGDRKSTRLKSTHGYISY